MQVFQIKFNSNTAVTRFSYPKPQPDFKILNSGIFYLNKQTNKANKQKQTKKPTQKHADIFSIQIIKKDPQKKD